MLNYIRDICRKYKISRMKWEHLENFFIGDKYSIIHPECIYIGDMFYAEDNLRLQAWKEYENQIFTPHIIIGSNVSMMENCQISCCSKISVGDGCLFGSNVFVTDNFHGNNTKEQVDLAPLKRLLYVKGEVNIGVNVWIGRNACIMPGVTIGNGAVIGANAVVTHDIPAYSVAVGVPAEVIKRVEKNS